jgi:hypothetical protein
MQASSLLRRVVKILLRRHGDVKSFEHELRAAGREAGRVDRGLQVVARQKIVGSVGRWRNLRSDFFYRTRPAVTERFIRIGQAMQRGLALPPLELYKMKVRRKGAKEEAEVSEYYVVDGHHRVAMARKLGQDFLDARVMEYKIDGTSKNPQASETSPAEQAPPAAAADSSGDTTQDEGQANPNDTAPGA